MRYISQGGEFLSEQVMYGETTVGMSRHIDSTGCVAYVISDRNGKLIESKFYDSAGRIVKQNDSSITMDFLKWICQAEK